jgi:hypothetical protein
LLIVVDIYLPRFREILAWLDYSTGTSFFLLDALDLHPVPVSEASAGENTSRVKKTIALNIDLLSVGVYIIYSTVSIYRNPTSVLCIPYSSIVTFYFFFLQQQHDKMQLSKKTFLLARRRRYL